MLVKADKVSGKVTGTKGDPVTDVKIDGEWYKLAAKAGTSFTGMIGIDGDTAENGGTYDLYCIDGVAYYVDEQQAGSTDTAYVLSTPGSLDVDGNYQVKLLFADGSTKVVGADKKYAKLNGKLVTYEIDDDAYELTLVENVEDHMAGGDSVATLTKFSKDDKKVVVSDSEKYRVADSAIVYVVYKDGGDKQKVITGATLNAMGADFGTAGTAVIDDGLATVVLLTSNSYLPGSNADKLYGYVTSDVVSNEEDNVKFRSFTVWTTNNESIDVKVKSNTADIDKGDLISFELTEDNYIESVKSESDADYKLNVSAPVAIKDFTSAWVSFYNGGDFDFDDDVKYMYVNTADTKGVNGGSLSKASETATSGVYYANAKYVLNDAGDEIVLIVVDTKNKWDDAANIMTAYAAAPTALKVESASSNGATVEGTTIDMLKATTGKVTSFADSSKDCVKLTATLAADTTATYQVQAVDGSYSEAQALTSDTPIDNIDLGATTGTAKIKVTVSQANCNDTVYELAITVE